MNNKGALIAILLLAFLMRFLWLDAIPSGFDMDEVQVGYNAYSLLKTARDENGTRLPLHTSFFNESRPMLSMYLASLSIALLGVNVFAVRASVAALGVLAVYLTYLMTKLLFRTERLALLSSGLLAISPWHIILTRSTSDGAVGLTSVLLSSIFFLRWINLHKWRDLFLIYISWTLAFFSYIGARPIIYLHAAFWIGSLLLIKKDKRNAIVLGLVLLVFTIFPTYLTVRSGEGLARYQQIGNITPQAAEARLSVTFLEESHSGTPLVLTRIFHNKLENSLREFLREYTKYINLNFLSVQGGFPIRYVVSEQPLEYWFETAFFLIGVFIAIAGRNYATAYVLFWFFSGAVPAALTTEDAPNLQRSVFMLPGFQILAAIGAIKLSGILRNRRKVLLRGLIGCLLIIGSWEVGRFIHQLAVHQPIHEPWHRNVQFAEIVDYVGEVEGEYQKVIISKSGTEPYLYFLFFAKVDPRTAQLQVTGRRDITGDWDMNDTLRFSKEPCPLSQTTMLESGVLYGNVGECAPVPGTEIMEEIRRPDNTVAMRFARKIE